MKLFKDILCKTVILFIFLSPWLLSASADQVEFCDSIPEHFAGWNSNVTLPKFDPEMGTLRAVDLFCKLNLSQEMTIENMNSEPANFTLNLSGALRVELPSSDNISISFNQENKGNLSGYDGVMDYAGSSGKKTVSGIPTQAASMSIADISDFLGSSPGESIVLPVSIDVSSRTKTTGTSSSGVLLSAGAKVCVSYTYDVKSGEGGQQ